MLSIEKMLCQTECKYLNIKSVESGQNFNETMIFPVLKNSSMVLPQRTPTSQIRV